MRNLPLADPGTPDPRSAARFLWWNVRLQMRTLLVGMLLSTFWMASGAFGPAIIGKAVDQGILGGETSRLLWWGLALFGTGVVSSIAGILGHRNAVLRWLTASYTTMQLVARQATRLGAQLPQQIPTGEVISVGASDVNHIGNFMETLSRAFAALVSFIVVAVILLTISVPLGLLVLIGAPVLLVLSTPLLKPLHTRQGRHRAAIGQLSTQGTDIVSGLRVLRGIGGEDTFARNYNETSQTVRRNGVGVGGMQALIDASGVLVSGVFVVALTWLGARSVVTGDLSVGELVALYGYAAFLMNPLRTTFDFADRVVRALVAGKRVVRVLSLTADLASPADPRPVPRTDILRQPGLGDLVDSKSGFRAPAGSLTAIVSDIPEDAAALADRLGRYVDPVDGIVTMAGISLQDMAIGDVRRTIVVNDTATAMFAGTLRDQLDVHHDHSDAELFGALHLAAAEDILDAVADGLDSEIEEKGRGFSGGQRQRLILARALLLDPEVLVLVEPTSAVDAHTEARIAERVHDSRRGRTTIVVTSSPLILARSDLVVLLSGGKTVSAGTHHDLLNDDRFYRSVVTRETEPEVRT